MGESVTKSLNGKKNLQQRTKNTVNEKKLTPWGFLPRGYIHVFSHYFQTSFFFSETTWPINAKYYVEPSGEVGKKIYINGSGHIAKMAAMPIYCKNI